MTSLRSRISFDQALPDVTELITQGRWAAASTQVGRCAFLDYYTVSSEHEYKTAHIHSGRIMRHAQIGYRSLERSCRAYAEIFEELQGHDCTVDRYGICLDWSMGYPRSQRGRMAKGTGLILDSVESFTRLTEQAPVAPHFGDFVMGMPAAFENTGDALTAGATSIGNLGQYFAFRLPEWDDDVTTTAETVKAISLCAAQPVPILIHSNLDDGFAALFTDLACALGAVLLEQYIVDDLLGGTVSHCYGHTYSEPLARLAFHGALSRVTHTPGTMVYGNTTAYGKEIAPNYAGLGCYLLVDILAQMTKPTGHAVNPVPVTEAHRIPDIDEIVDAQLFAHRLIERAGGFKPLIDSEHPRRAADKIIEGARLFKINVLRGFEQGGIDISNPLEMLLAIRRLGPRYLEEQYGPGEIEAGSPRGRNAVFMASALSELERQADNCVSKLSERNRQFLGSSKLEVYVATTDVHEYGKLLIENVLARLGIRVMDGGVCTDPRDLIARVKVGSVNVIAISTYNGIALDYLTRVKSELENAGLSHIPVYIGGRLNQVMESDRTANSDLPVDVSKNLHAAGAIPCHCLEDMLLDMVNRFL